MSNKKETFALTSVTGQLKASQTVLQLKNENIQANVAEKSLKISFITMSGSRLTDPCIGPMARSHIAVVSTHQTGLQMPLKYEA